MLLQRRYKLSILWCKSDVKEKDGYMELEKHKITLYTNADIEDIPEDIERLLYLHIGAGDIDEAFEKCRDNRNIRKFEITITVEAM
jgi:hypothetical protein